MRKYEPAGGVVPCEWKRGAPSESDEYGVILREEWSLKWDWNGRPEATARVTAYRWDRDAKEWRSVDGSGGGRTIRWMRVGRSRTADLSLTLEDWPNA